MIRKLVTGAVFNILNILVQVVLGLLVFREMLLHFGETDFGIWSLLFALLAHIQLCEFGLGSMISKLVPSLSKPNSTESQSHFSTAFFTINGLFLIFLFVLIILSFYAHTIPNPFESDTPLGLVVFLLGLNFLFIFLCLQIYSKLKFFFVFSLLQDQFDQC